MTLQAKTFPFGKGQLTIKTIAPNAVRIQYSENVTDQELPDWLYVKQDEVAGDLSVDVDNKKNTVTVKDKNGRKVFVATSHQLRQGQATLTITSPKDEYLYGLGQFQDGYSNIRGLSRRLTQVNTQISIPMMISSKGYGLLWNNYGLTEFNPSSQSVTLSRANSQQAANSQVVNVTSTEGSKQEVREQHIYEATLTVKEEGDYALLLDVGQKMARRHHLTIDGQTVIEMQNTWLPPTTSAIVHLTAGRHTLSAELSRGDAPVVYYNKVANQTVFRTI
jgi:alpha-D-xyloside xylohydrolase